MQIEKSECNYQVTECDFKFGEQITLDGELLITISVLDKIRAEIQKLRNCSCSCSDGIIDDVEEILDKYKAEGSEKE